MEDIAYQNKDITSKMIAEALKGKSLAPFGLPHLRVVEILPTNLPAVESNELRLDNLFVLDDGSVAIIDYESKYGVENFVKYLNYMARIVRRYELRHELEKLRSLKVIVIYTADVEQAAEEYDLGGLRLKIESSYLIRLDTGQIYSKIRRKVEEGEPLTDEELMKLMILPLTVKGRKGKEKAIETAVELAKRLPERGSQLRALAGILTFSDKVIDREYSRRLKEEMQMTLVGQMLMEEGFQKGIQKGIQAGIEKGVQKGQEEGIRAFIEDKAEEGVPQERILEKLKRHFHLDEAQAQGYYEKYHSGGK